MKQILCFAWAFFVLGNGYMHAQDCECDKNYEKIFVDQKDKWMHGMYHDDKQLGGHPYSTFSKTHPGSYIEGCKNLSGFNEIRSVKYYKKQSHKQVSILTGLAAK